jgi:hypothetical protein
VNEEITEMALNQVRGTKREAAVLALRELAKTAKTDYTGLASYSCSERETEKAEFLIEVATRTADRLEAE